MRVTLKDIAQRAGVSSVTVSKVLNGHVRGLRGSSKERANRIRKIAQELGYQPNTAARAMATGRHHAIGLVSEFGRSPSSAVFAGMYQTILSELTKDNTRLILGQISHEQIMQGESIPLLLQEQSMDGMIFDCIYKDSEVLDALLSTTTIPAVMLNAPVDHDTVRPDDYEGGRQATQYLLSLGHKHIAYIHLDSSSQHYSKGERRRGYEDVMEEALLDCIFFDSTYGSGPNDRYHVIQAMLKEHPEVTAVVAYSVDQALPLHAAALGLGYKMPEDLSIIMFYDDTADWRTGLTFDTMIIPVREMGLEAVRMLFRKIENPGIVERTVVIPYSQRRVGTCMPPKSRTG